MLETNVINFSEEKKPHVDLKTETKGDDIREEIEDNTIRIISSLVSSPLVSVFKSTWGFFSL